MKCPECGRENDEGAVMCAGCGWVLVWVDLDKPRCTTSRMAISYLSNQKNRPFSQETHPIRDSIAPSVNRLQALPYHQDLSD